MNVIGECERYGWDEANLSQDFVDKINSYRDLPEA